MVTAKTQYNLKNAEQYFEEHLCVGDYYKEGQRVSGEWVGVGAERLALSGKSALTISCGCARIKIPPQARS